MAKDVDLFAAAMAGVKPLEGSKRGARRRKPAVAGPPPAPPAKRAADTPKAVQPAPAGPSGIEVFDRDVDRALARGRRQPEATLDLHGMTLAAAERAVAGFLAESTEQGRRVVLVVTGKGLRVESGKLFGGRIRAEFPAWLERPENRSRVAGVRQAHPRHGGSGAFYLLLKRRTVRA